MSDLIMPMDILTHWQIDVPGTGSDSGSRNTRYLDSHGSIVEGVLHMQYVSIVVCPSVRLSVRLSVCLCVCGHCLQGLGFTVEMQGRATMKFSGGWRMRVSLARCIVEDVEEGRWSGCVLDGMEPVLAPSFLTDFLYYV